MTTLKVMGIIGLVLATLAFLCLVAFNNYSSYESAIGWGMIAVFYLVGYSIVGIVQSKKNK